MAAGVPDRMVAAGATPTHTSSGAPRTLGSALPACTASHVATLVHSFIAIRTLEVKKQQHPFQLVDMAAEAS